MKRRSKINTKFVCVNRQNSVLVSLNVVTRIPCENRSIFHIRNNGILCFTKLFHVPYFFHVHEMAILDLS
jgi:hypothetical protein